MALISSVISWFIKKRIHQINLFRSNPNEVQKDVLDDLLKKAKDTEWGKRYNFQSIKTIDEYRNRVPINDYESLKHDIQRTRNGEQNILWGSKIKYFAKSSGTTSDKSKYIPISEESLEECHYKAGKDILSIYCNNHPDTTIFDGKGLIMGGSSNISEINNTAYYDGDLSAILLQNFPWIGQFFKTPSISIALMEEWEAKIEKIARETCNHNVTSMSGVPSWTLVLIKRILEIKGTENLKEVWPNLEVFFHGGISFKPYVSQYEKYIKKGEINYVETYNASEGYFAIQDQVDNNEMLLMLDYGIYYEFLPIENLHDEHPKTLTLSEVELYKNYALIISTNGGLWRYLIGDTIMFTCLSPFRIKITGRTKSFINAVGEELIIENAEKALLETSKKLNLTINDYTAAPIYFSEQKNASHEWLIEFENPPEDLQKFINIFDEELKKTNSDYEAKRYKDMVLRMPIVKIMPKNTFYNWLKNKNRLGGQNKVPRLCNNRKYVDSILDMLENNK